MRSVSDPTSYKLLADFACGGESEYERDVENALDELRGLAPEHADAFELRAAEARHGDDLIALSVFHKRPLGESEHLRNAVYLALTAVNEPYRGCRMPDGATRIGTFMLCDTLAQIENLWGDPMPYVWGIVHQDNKGCHNVLSRHSFWRLKGSNREPNHPYFVHMRQEGLGWAHGFSPLLLQAVERASAE